MFIDDVVKVYSHLKSNNEMPQAIFKIDNVYDYINSLPVRGETLNTGSFLNENISIRPPFAKTWFEFDNFGVLCMNANEIYFKTEEQKQVAKKHIIDTLAPIMSLPEIEKLQEDPCENVPITFEVFYKIKSLGVDGIFNMGTMIHRDGENSANESIFEYLHIPFEGYGSWLTSILKENKFSEEICGRGAVTSMLALQFLNCKNIIRQENQIKKKRIGQQKRIKKLYFEKYYTLAIEPMKKILNEEGQAQTHGIKHAMHVCRGHFKRRKTGVYWWSDHVRGNSQVGVIKKDYAINV